MLSTRLPAVLTQRTVIYTRYVDCCLLGWHAVKSHSYQLFGLSTYIRLQDRRVKPTVETMVNYLRSEVFTAVTRKNTVFWDVAPCRSCLNRRFGGTYSLHLQGIKSVKEESAWASLQPPAHAGSLFANFSTLKMEVIRSSETSVHTRSIRRHIPEDGILQW
jgi:hypothetical protein